jgi:hypothetical protein
MTYAVGPVHNNVTPAPEPHHTRVAWFTSATDSPSSARCIPGDEDKQIRLISFKIAFVCFEIT